MPHPPVFGPIGSPFTELQSVDSTNNYALARAHAGMASHGEAFFAQEQLLGKGQMGKKWTSKKKENIILSIGINPAPLQLSQQFWLSAATSVGVHDFFKKYAADDTRIKWPNDLYWQDRKAGGILIESIIGSQDGSKAWKWAVIGMAININQVSFPQELLNPVSLKQITGKTFDAMDLAKELCACIDTRFDQLMKEGLEPILTTYNSNLYKRDETVKLKKDNRTFEAVIKSVSNSGRLIVYHSIEEEFAFGEIEWMK